ncbi:MAG TPA: alpha-L-arabinofuranosidase C-terminal domain-containing protein [Tepidisphaeraceae bacterium]|nr:alpha-L-arabinofuranosidase C-terminal domain-containing protein [Tepidisphaeraceae bacterium]
MKYSLLIGCILVGMASMSRAQESSISLNVQVDKPGAAISPILNGIFFEDINFAADGGLYPERLKNRSFEFEDPMMGWRKTERGGVVGGFGLSEDRPLSPNNPHFLRVLIEQPGGGMVLTNEGFRGIGVKQGAKYTFSVYVRAMNAPGAAGGQSPQSITVELQGANNRAIAEPQSVTGFTTEWKKYSCTVEPTTTEPKAKLAVVFKGAGTLDVDMLSLYPDETFNNRPNGLRPDLAQLLKDLKPGFMRFPGGCIVEGRVLDQRYQWKTTIGDVNDRKLIMNRWNVEFAAPRNAPDYYQSFGLGFFEYFQLCEDIGAKPLPILNCGMSCQFNLGELQPMDQLDPYIQDVLDLIEFANGPADSAWGAKRAAMGHPQPFGLTMVGIGNEQWGPQYVERYEKFAKTIKAKYPRVQLVSGAGPDPSGASFDFAWKELKRLNADIIDEHFYRPPEFFYANVNRYDKYDRNGPKVFAGEFAAHTRPVKKNNWEAALAEAALMTGLERNGDIVQLASYAPLFAHVDAWQWNPNLIWFDNLRSFGTPNYYVQKLFSANRGSKILPVKLGDGQKIYACASLNETGSELILKVVNADSAAHDIRVNLGGAGNIQKTAQIQVLSSSDLQTENTLDEPTRLSPVESTIDNAGANFSHSFPGYSLSIVRLTIK